MQASLSECTRDRLAQLVAARGLAARGAPWAWLDGGRTNQTWRVAGPSREIVVKLFAQDDQNPLFPNDPLREIQVLLHLEGLGLAPKLLDHFATPFGSCVIYEHLPGQRWQNDPAQAANLLRRLHAVAPPDGLRTAPDGSCALRQQGEMILARCPPAQASWARALRPKTDIAPAGVTNLLHGDPVPGNIIGASQDWRLIDWQCPGIGDPCEDIAIFLSPAMQLAYRGKALSRLEIQDFLKAYGDAKILERYAILAAWYHWRMLAYCLWQQANGDLQAETRAQAEAEALHLS
ncbi:MAG: phosphotransferase [Roseovarius sp.]|nr:phosphotransferase [Roseovarius sp.]